MTPTASCTREADGVPGLVVDRYGDHLVLQVGSAAVEKRIEWVLGSLQALLSPAGILLRGDSASRKREGLDTGVRVLTGEVPETVIVREGPVRYEAHLRGGQKTGGFLDQRENHLAAGRYASGRVLDVFSYAGGFALHAARGAAEVEAVDSSGPALDAARCNAELNGLQNLSFTRANAFDLLRERSDAGERYDAVILDPPAFAKAKRDLPKARRAYKEINLRAMRLLGPGGILVTCSCSYHLSREHLRGHLALRGRRRPEDGAGTRVEGAGGGPPGDPDHSRDPLPQVRDPGGGLLASIHFEGRNVP